MITLNLQDYRTLGSKVFTGRDRGIDVRRRSKIDSLINGNEQIVLVIPEDIRSINPSFLEEFLLNVVIKLGKNGFNEKFIIKNEGRYKVDVDLQDAIERILRNENALA